MEKLSGKMWRLFQHIWIVGGMSPLKEYIKTIIGLVELMLDYMSLTGSP